MGEPVSAIKKDELKSGEMKVVTVRGKNILVARSGDNYYAADKRCPHMGGDLGKGNLDGTIVTCPLHGSQFDLVDGKVVRWTNFTGLTSKVANILKSPKPLNVYKVKIEGDQVLVEI